MTNMLENEKIRLRALEPDDIDILYEWENDSSLWHLSNTLVPFSRFTLEQYVLNADRDIYTHKQLRLMINKKNGESEKSIGSIDLFDFDPTNKRSGVGIMIVKNERDKGFASEALKMVVEYAFNGLNLHQLYCNIHASNTASLALFQHHGFKISGTKKDWLLVKNEWVDEYTLQCINKG